MYKAYSISILYIDLKYIHISILVSQNMYILNLPMAFSSNFYMLDSY